jgi:hypothetical protein
VVGGANCTDFMCGVFGRDMMGIDAVKQVHVRLLHM